VRAEITFRQVMEKVRRKPAKEAKR
jgi:hypothetical protein